MISMVVMTGKSRRSGLLFILIICSTSTSTTHRPTY